MNDKIKNLLKEISDFEVEGSKEDLLRIKQILNRWHRAIYLLPKG